MRDMARYEEPTRKSSPSDEELELFHGYEEEFDDNLYNTEASHGYDCRCSKCREAEDNEYFLGDLWDWGSGLFDYDISYTVKSGEAFGKIHKSTRPPGLPTYARKTGEPLSALEHVRDSAQKEKLGEVFVRTIEQMAKTESGARFALPAEHFNANPPSKRPPGKKLVTAWGVFQFNRDAWTCLLSEDERRGKRSYVSNGDSGCFGCSGKGGCVFPWDCTAKEEIESPIKKYAQLFRDVQESGGGQEDAAVGMRIWHKSPGNLYGKWLKKAKESGFRQAWTSVLSEPFRSSIRSFLNKAAIVAPHDGEVGALYHTENTYDFDEEIGHEFSEVLNDVGEFEFGGGSDIEEIRAMLEIPIVRDPFTGETLEEYIAWHDDDPNNFGRYFRATELTTLHKPSQTPCTISPKSLPRTELPPQKYWNRIIPTRYLAGFLRYRMGVPLKVAHSWRPKWFNDHVCGEPESQHLKFSAMDIDLLTKDRSPHMMEKLYQEAVKIYVAVGPLFDMGLGLYRSGGIGPRVHIDTGWRMRTWKPGYAQKVADKLGLTLPKR